MSSYTDTRLADLGNALLRKLRKSMPHPREGADLLNAIEKVVDGTDSRIRLVSGYRRKLQDAVVTALAFVDELVAGIPQAIEISARTFASNPYVNAFFVNPADLQTVISHSSEIRDFTEVHVNREDLHCCCLLCMQKTERPMLGMELSGDILKTDVQQTAVSFSDHRIYSPAPTETAAREGLRECLLEGLITSALGRIMQDKLGNYRLQSERRMLYEKLRHLEYKSKYSNVEQQDRASITDEIGKTRENIRVLEDRLMGIRPVTPQASLKHINDSLQHPEHYIRMRKSSLHLDKMGIVIDADSTRPCNNLDLTEVVIDQEPPRVITLAQFPLREFTPQSGFPAPRTFS